MLDKFRGAGIFVTRRAHTVRTGIIENTTRALESSLLVRHVSAEG